MLWVFLLVQRKIPTCWVLILEDMRQKHARLLLPSGFFRRGSWTKPSSRRRNAKQSSLPMNLKDIPLQFTHVCTSWPNPLPDAAAFISFSDLLCFQTGAPHLLISRHSKQNQSYWTHPHVPALFGIPPLSTDSSPGLQGGVLKSLNFYSPDDDNRCLDRRQNYENLEIKELITAFFCFPVQKMVFALGFIWASVFLSFMSGEWWWIDQVDVRAGTHCI